MEDEKKMKILMWTLFAFATFLAFAGYLGKDQMTIVIGVILALLGGKVHTDIRLMRLKEKVETKIKCSKRRSMDNE